MKVKHLIKKLQEQDPEAIAVVQTSNFEQGQSTVRVGRVSPFKGNLRSEEFRDAFDGGTYNKEVVIINFKNDSGTNCVRIAD